MYETDNLYTVSTACLDPLKQGPGPGHRRLVVGLRRQVESVSSRKVYHV
jgi:hypothetical protein